MRPAVGAAPARPGPAAKKMKKTVKQLQPRAEEAAAVAERAAAEQAAEEAARRARHLKELSRASGAERELEELVFGDSLNVEEEELLQRLAGPPRVGLGARRAASAPRPSRRPGPPPRGERGEAARSAVPRRARCFGSLSPPAPRRCGCQLPAPIRGWAKMVCLVVFS